MIKFQGKISGNCNKYVKKRIKKVTFLSLLVACLPLITIMLVLMIKSHWVYSVGLITLLLIPFVAFLPPGQKTLNSILPDYVLIYEETIISKGKNFTYTIKISNIKKIIDFGEWYQIIFINAKRNPCFVCQKNLLVQGTIEEFEELFKDKIVKK